jgi:hypothetical protein
MTSLREEIEMATGGEPEKPEERIAYALERIADALESDGLMERIATSLEDKLDCIVDELHTIGDVEPIESKLDDIADKLDDLIEVLKAHG